MSERPSCRCPLCRIETELLNDFLNTARIEAWRKVLSSAPELMAFSGPQQLLAHLRQCRDASSTDAVLRALLRARETLRDGTIESMVLLAFLPQLHTSLRSITRRFPQLSPEDASQNTFQCLLRFLDSEQLQARQDYLGFAVARRVKRAAFEWAEHEMRSLIFEPGADAPELHGSADPFERLVLLRHFLDRALRHGILNTDELDLLIQFKLENGMDEDTPEFHSNAHRQRLKRLVRKLRRLAAARRTSRNGH